MGIQKVKQGGNWTTTSWDMTDFLFYPTNFTSKQTSFFKMAAKRLAMGQKGIRDLWKVFICCIQKLKHDENWTDRSWDIIDFMFHLSKNSPFSKTDAKGLTVGWKVIGGLLKVFSWGIQKFKHDGNWMTISWDLAEFELWDLEYSLVSYSIHAAILKLDFRKKLQVDFWGVLVCLWG